MPDDALEARHRTVDALESPVDAREGDAVRLVEELAQQAQLRREVVVERGNRDTGPGRHVARRRPLEAVLGDDLHGRTEDRGLPRSPRASHGGQCTGNRTIAKFRGMADAAGMGDLFAIDVVDIRGVPTKVFRNAPPSLRAIWDLSARSRRTTTSSTATSA